MFCCTAQRHYSPIALHPHGPWGVFGTRQGPLACLVQALVFRSLPRYARSRPQGVSIVDSRRKRCLRRGTYTCFFEQQVGTRISHLAWQKPKAMTPIRFSQMSRHSMNGSHTETIGDQFAEGLIVGDMVCFAAFTARLLRRHPLCPQHCCLVGAARDGKERKRPRNTCVRY